MDENTENLPGTPPEVAEAAGAVNLLPEKSQKLYKIAYNQFMKWKQEKKITSFSERVILAYFADLSSKYKISTLWTYYSMLRSTLNINHNINIEQYHKLRAFLKRQGENYQPKKAKTVSPQQITKFITEAPDVKYLATKVALIMGIMGACRTQELHSMRIQDIKDLNSAFLVTLPNTKTKIRRSFTENCYEINTYDAPVQRLGFIVFLGMMGDSSPMTAAGRHSLNKSLEAEVAIGVPEQA
ncbi:hypothetical protein Zmor_014830 [Zophobas morio]|uniref:Uncharacterized protein n=1 Tax=Zophobas morio TaxID=2755281 RepID=A0AA38IFZ9_9CUCU|nr:hypothetical protein Zmor_014830 [Zophobas morio]